MTIRPFLLDPVFATKPWGGSQLARMGKAVPPGVTIGESWEVADLPRRAVSAVEDPRSRVRTGAAAGQRIRDVTDAHGADFLGSVAPTPEGDFPLLVKLLDAGQHLSVQVHPDEAYVQRHPDARLKTESWYVVGADPGATLFLGFVDGVTIEDVERSAGTPDFVDLLQSVPVGPGDFFHVPAGTVHAVGAGTLIAEVQTPSDTTFRIYDWNDEYDRPVRDMHIEEALETLVIEAPAPAPPAGAGPSRLLESNRHYWIVEHAGDTPVEIARSPEVRILMIIDGTLEIDGLTVSTGDTVMVPAVCAPTTTVRPVTDAVVLEIGLSAR